MEDWKKKTLETYDRIAGNYAERDRTVYKDLCAEEKSEFLNLLAKDKAEILDIGVGAGRDAKFFSENGHNLTGIDISEEMLANARTNAPKGNFIVMDIENFDFPANSFDGIWANASLMHIPKENLKKVFPQIVSSLKEDGVMFARVKYGNNEDGMLTNKKFDDTVARYFAFYTEDQLKQLCEDNDLDLISLKKSENDEDPNRIGWIEFFAKKGLMKKVS